MEKENFHSFGSILSENSNERLVIIAKPNFKDFAIMFPLFKIMRGGGEVSKIFFCGPFASLNAKSMLEENEWLDGIIIDQVESVAGKLLEMIQRNVSIKECKGGIWRENQSIVEYVPSEAYILLNQLPFPARDVEKEELGSYINIEASRGCIYNCSFCHIPLATRKEKTVAVMDFRDPVKVVDEMELLNKEIGKKLFIFNDSVFWASGRDNDRILKFCSEIKRRKLDIRMYVYLRCNPFIHDEVLNALADAGLVRVFLGVENASEKSQILFRKPIKKDSFIEIREKLNRLNVNVHIGYITFEPFSTLDDIQMNLEYLYKIGKLFRLGVILEPVRVIPGSFMHKKLLEGGLISTEARYRDITYGYRFLNDDVGRLFEKAKSIFSGNFGGIAYEFEYYCTTMGILYGLIQKENIHLGEELSLEHQRFCLSQKELMDSIYVFLSSLIAKVGKGDSMNDCFQKDFTEKFSEKFFKLKIEYFTFINGVSRLGRDDILSQIYSGLERTR
ncbi:MAG: radical SAM protein [Candidatus Moraniibacteriota bacterium]|nr:MAG: radical SAM protein [Candidatus Moranbacteria bacterium]